jgi:nicotinamidase-related amidase
MEVDAEKRNLGRWALIVVDLQNDFLAKGGYYDRRTQLDPLVKQEELSEEARNQSLVEPSAQPQAPFQYRDPSLAPIITNIGALIANARAQQRPIAFVRAVYSRDHDVLPPSLRNDPARQHFACKPNTWGAQWIEPIAQLVHNSGETPQEQILEKHTYDGFFHTKLLRFLNEQDVDTVLVAGAETHICILTTAQSAAFHGYRVLIPEDCVWTAQPKLGEAALAIFRDGFGSTRLLNSQIDR